MDKSLSRVKHLSSALPRIAVAWLFCAFLSAAVAEEAPKPDPNPPSAVKLKQVKWPGLVTIFHGDNWGDNEKYLQAIQEAGFGATGCSEAQIPQVAKYKMLAYVFIWPHEASAIPAKYKNNDTVLCYYLSDRTRPNKWGLWAGFEKNAYAADPFHPAVFTMAPREYGGVDQFLPVVRARIIEYYHYHWDAGRAPHMHFPILEMIRKESLKAGGIPICRIVETRAEDVRKTRQTIFTSLAYGVRGFRTGGRGLFAAERDARGVPKRTIHGDEAVKFNQAIRAFSPVFEEATSVDVFHTPPLPPGTKEAPADYWMRPSGAEILVGEFAHPSGNKFLVVANRDAFAAHEAKLQLKGEIASVERMDKATAKWQPLKLTREKDTIVVTLPVEEGGGELVGVKFEK